MEIINEPVIGTLKWPKPPHSSKYYIMEFKTDIISASPILEKVNENTNEW